MERVLIYGGRGALGSACVNYFKSKIWWVVSVDFSENQDADHSIVIDQTNSGTLVSQYQQVEGDLLKLIEEDKIVKKEEDIKFNAILNLAGGWCGGNAHSKDFVKNCDLALKQSVWTSCISTGLAAKFLNQNGILVLPSASASLHPTPGMVAYGMAKSCVNHLTSSIGQKDGGLPANTTALALLPVILDTPMNRKWMPNADFSTFTPLQVLAEKIYEWSSKAESLPQSGSLIEVKTLNGDTTFTSIN